LQLALEIALVARVTTVGELQDLLHDREEVVEGADPWQRIAAAKRATSDREQHRALDHVQRDATTE
jgi:hypothetical protein